MSSELCAAIEGRSLVFVGGKGGVGKTTVASALALHAARSGRWVRLVSTDPAHSLGHLWGARVGDRGGEVAPRLLALELDPEALAERHLALVGEALRRRMPSHLREAVDRQLALARDAPGLHESALLERIAELVETHAEDEELLVFDTAPTGHTLRLLALPQRMLAWTRGLLARRAEADRLGDVFRRLGDDAVADRVFGSHERDEEIMEVLERRRDRFEILRRRLTDVAGTAFVLVLTAERLPVLESIELARGLRGAGITPSALVVNRRSPGSEGPFLATRRGYEDEQLQALARSLPSLPIAELPLLAREPVGAEELLALTHALFPFGPPSPGADAAERA